jgi:glutamyl-tRNA synthetase
MSRPVRTRFAPSPTGYLHVGGARTALYSWAYARRHGGTFILRIEDTDIERSTQASIDAILEGMGWLGLAWDEGPFHQMQRLGRYNEVARQLIADGHAYWCYASKEDLDAMREAQRAAGVKPRYDGRWRPENARGKTPPADVNPILRFRNPDDGVVAWDDLVKGRIEIANAELDDLVLMRADGVPTYNFGVVVDDLDMGISHCIRGDDHVNNTPRQINIYRALRADMPAFAHVPMILGSDGERLSKRHGAVSVMQYAEDGFLPQAMLNYLARLGWSHGNDELFSLDQFVDWFDLEHISRSPAQFNPEKLAWLNQQYLRSRDDGALAEEVAPRLSARGIGTLGGPRLEKVLALYKDRASTLNELADAVEPFYVEVYPGADLLAQHLTDAARGVLRDLHARLQTTIWECAQLNQALKDVVAARGMKLPQLAIPLRVVLTGQPQTPSIDAVLEAFGRDIVLARLSRHI